MSDVPEQQISPQPQSKRWYYLLAVFSIVFACLCLLRLQARWDEPAFEDVCRRASSLIDAGFYPEAGEYIESLLAQPKRLPEQKRQLHRLMAEIVFAIESKNTLHGESNAAKIIEHIDNSLAQDEPYGARLHWMRSYAWEWLHHPDQALSECQQAVAKNIDNLWEAKKRLIEIQRSTGGLTAEQLHEAYDEILSNQQISEDLRYWAVEQKVELYARQEKYDEAQQFLAENIGQFHSTAQKKRSGYLQALVWFRVKRLNEAEQLLCSLWEEMSPTDELYARSGWLLGQVRQANNKPESALAIYEEVAAQTPDGPYRSASMLGRAQTLAALRRYDESIEAYNEVVKLAGGDSYESKIDPLAVRKSITALYQELAESGMLSAALGYLRLATRLVPQGNTELQAVYAGRLANLYVELGKAAINQADADGLTDDSPVRQQAQRHLLDAGGEYLRLAGLVVDDESASAGAVWQAADAFDLAGEPERTITVFERFVADRSDGKRVPVAFHRLGQTYQAIGKYAKAIEKYRQNLQRFGQTEWASLSLLAMAECYIAMNQQQKAERILIGMVDRDQVVESYPVALNDAVSKDALFKLGELYLRTADYEKAIARYREALKKYVDDAQSFRATFMLADAYRKSAARIRDDLNKEAKNSEKEHLQKLYVQRLKEAGQQYERVIERYGSRAVSSLNELDRLYLKLSYFYGADAVFDNLLVAGAFDGNKLSESLGLYERAASKYEGDPITMSAYVQMIDCCLLMNRPVKVRDVLNRARSALDNIPADSRAEWMDYLSWLESVWVF